MLGYGYDPPPVSRGDARPPSFHRDATDCGVLGRIARKFLAIIGPNLRTHRRIDSLLDHKSALSQKILDIPIAQREPEVEPDSMSDDVRWKSVAGVGDALARWSLTCQCPAAARRTGAPDNAEHKTNEERHCETNFRSGHGRRSP